MILTLVFLPFFGFITAGYLGGCIGIGSCFITTYFIFLSLCFSLFLFVYIGFTHSVHQQIFDSWINIDFLNVSFGFSIDSLTAVMLVVVTLISFFVHLYSIEYMSEDPHLPRFMSYLSFFTFFMLILITANNFLQMFIGWEGVGLCSFLLINFWFTRVQANKAAIKAMLMNRVGDFFLLLALFSIFYLYKTFDYDIIFSITPLMASSKVIIFGTEFFVLDAICFFLFLGAMGKSAQLGLHTWLPDAMEGPTPVSALIHAATMVTAGVFLIARCSYLFEYSPNILNLIIIIGSITCFFAASTGLFQNDIKRIIAYSTCSQLGYMMFACGLSNYDVGIFHLTNHAFFKALLFLGAGAIIHSLADEQDIRKMGGLKTKLSFYYVIFLIGSLALIGFPFLAGFYSKDVILEVAFAKQNVFSLFAYILGILGAFCTAFYSTRLIILVFLVNPNGYKKIMFNIHYGSIFINGSLIFLAFLSIFSGYLLYHFFIGFGTDFWGLSFFILPENYLLLDIEFLPIIYKLLPLIFTIFGVISAINIYFFNLKIFYKLKSYFISKALYTFLLKKWYFDRIYNQIISQSILNLGLTYTYDTIDRGVLDFNFGSYGMTKFIEPMTKINQKFHTGFVSNYLYLVLFISMSISLICFLISFSQFSIFVSLFSIFLFFFL